MDWNVFWAAFGAIGGTIGSLATAGAIGVALWQTKYPYKKELKVKFAENAGVIDPSGKTIAEFICLTVVNSGNRDVVIQKIGIVAKKNKILQIIANPAVDALPIGIKEHFMISLPCSLTIENSVDFYYDKKAFKAILKEDCDKKHIGKNRKVVFFIQDTTGRRYYVKSPRTAKNYFS